MVLLAFLPTFTWGAGCFSGISTSICGVTYRHTPKGLCFLAQILKAPEKIILYKWGRIVFNEGEAVVCAMLLRELVDGSEGLLTESTA